MDHHSFTCFLRRVATRAQRRLCIHCGRLMVKPTAEHMAAKRDGGKSTRQNIAAACQSCNHERHAKARYAGLDADQYGWMRLVEAAAMLI